jgi:hypothetical protein
LTIYNTPSVWKFEIIIIVEFSYNKYFNNLL